MTPDIFYRALAWDDYVVSMQINRDLLRRQRGQFVLPAAERQRWARGELSAWHVLVFTEDWCQDSITALPPLLAIAEVASFEIGVMRRSDELMLLRALTKNEWPPVPVFLFYDADWNEQGRFLAMPQEFRRMKHDPAEAIWLKEMYDEIWWETEIEELARIVP
jgi:hypothetical protein